MKFPKVRTGFMKFFGGKKETVAFFLILILSIILRFANYGNRFGIAADQARDVLVAREALRMHTLPLIGPFSASGPYVFGPFWYWALLIPVALFHNTLLAPWIFITSLYVVSVFLMFLIGKKLINSRFALLLSLITALSPAEIQLSTNLIMSAFVGFLSVCIFYFFVRYIKDKKLADLSFMSLLIGIAINTHFEAVPLIVLPPLAIFFGKRSFAHCVTAAVLCLIPFIPLTIFNMQSHSYEFTHIFLTNAPPQKLSLLDSIEGIVRREGTFIGITLPYDWNRVITKFRPEVGYAILILFIGTLYYAFQKHLLQKEITILYTAAAIISVIVGYYNGVLFGNFLEFLNPLFFIFTAWMCLFIVRFNKYAGIAVTIVLLTLTIYADITLITTSTNVDAAQGHRFENALTAKYPKQQFAVYERTTATKNEALTLSLFLDVDGYSSDTGLKIGVAHIGAPVNHQVIFDDLTTGVRIYNLDGTPDTELAKESFTPYNQNKIYASVEDWYK